MKGIIFVVLWYSSILCSVYFIYVPLIPLMLISRPLFRTLTDIILVCWEMYPAVLLELLMGCRIVISGDKIKAKEGAILLMNHRNRLDWFFLWAGLVHATTPPCHRSKFVLKSDVRKIPGIGWGLQLANFLFIHRNWEMDKVLLAESLDYYRDLGKKYQILLFAEGTDLSPSNKESSHAFARKNGLPLYDYVLHPRTTGFSFLANRMRANSQIDAVYDLTIAYPKTLPESEKDILAGKIPQEVHFKINRYPVNDLPQDESELRKWCEDRWAEKEKVLAKFYSQKDRSFSASAECDEPWNVMYLVFVFWTTFTVLACYLVLVSSIARYWVVICTIVLVMISQFTDGIQRLEIWLNKRAQIGASVKSKMT